MIAIAAGVHRAELDHVLQQSEPAAPQQASAARRMRSPAHGGLGLDAAREARRRFDRRHPLQLGDHQPQAVESTLAGVALRDVSLHLPLLAVGKLVVEIGREALDGEVGSHRLLSRTMRRRSRPRAMRDRTVPVRTPSTAAISS